MNQPTGRYLLSIEAIPATVESPSHSAEAALPSFPAYLVGSTAPNNVEDGVQKVPDPEIAITEIAKFLSTQAQPEILIAIHGYNTGLGEFATAQDGYKHGSGVKGWYQNIRNHIAKTRTNCPPGLMLIGYRWPSEEVKGVDNDTLGHKLQYARKSLPLTLKVISRIAIAIFIVLLILSLVTDLPGTLLFSIVGVSLLVLATVAISIVFTFFALRIVGYFRDAYRANHFGVPDLVELIRQLDKAVLEETPGDDWTHRRRIKLSFIGHSMGGFVVTNTVRILSDVFDTRSIGHTSINASKAKTPAPDIGNVFSLGRLVLVSPDIPAETIISGRANFLSSSLRRFEETYLFSNEGDMALKLASTIANYSSFPARTREGGYRLGNVVLRSPHEFAKANRRPQYGILNLESLQPPRSQTDRPAQMPSFLQYLYILDQTSLRERQADLIEPERKPIAELFTVFDCTDYQEIVIDQQTGSPKKVGLLSHALGKRSLTFVDCFLLTIDYFRGKIDTHGGYFFPGDLPSAVGKNERLARPDARLTKHLIYGLASSGFTACLESLSTYDTSEAASPMVGEAASGCEIPPEQRVIYLKKLSELCQQHGIQVLLAAERYNRDVLGLTIEGDRDGY
ncbi:MAG: alpha/beta hydrolase [Phormidesmis sp.]